MIGAIIGDVIGSVYEWHNVKTEDFPRFSRFTRFTDDTVLTCAVANAILRRGKAGVGAVTEAEVGAGGAMAKELDVADGRQANDRKRIYAEQIKAFARRYPNAGYGGNFIRWMQGDSYRPYNSYGNGSAMRVSPVGHAFGTLEEVLEEAELSASVTHNHPEGIKGAKAVAGSVFLARMGASKEEIKKWVEDTFKYDLGKRLDEIRPSYKFDVSCQGSVPQAITAFLESDSFEDAIRKAISLGGDSDTIAAISGAIAEAFYGVPGELWGAVQVKLDGGLLQVVGEFRRKFPAGR